MALMTHSLVAMVQEAGGHVRELGGVQKEARELDLHYIPSRHPNGLPSGYPHQFYGQEMAREAVQNAEKIVSLVRTYYENQKEEEILVSDEP
ncbi:HEPN domain-containing protein [Acidobacteria bacterium AH-259-L09]|nr:HEPN domain-containing protein [Acidobacteria bacterium AH-259-L09]